jgi:hypothetical protein
MGIKRRRQSEVGAFASKRLRKRVNGLAIRNLKLD